jgi:cell wall-associated NlpC family hydrolase
MMHKYVGIPFVDRGCDTNGCDCYGLVKLFYATEFNITIPDFHSGCKDTRRIFIDYLHQISRYWDTIEYNNIEFGDVIAMAYDPSHPKIVQHFAIYIGNGKILQALDKIGVFICDINEYTRYIKGIYRWKKSD